jgi:5-methylcytosine-specific restriction protein A
VPNAALRYCAQPGCPRLVQRGRCQAHTRTERDRPNVDVRKWYRTARWAALRAQKMAEQPLCVECERAGIVEPWTDLDHIRPHRSDPVLFYDCDNLQGLCKQHHSAKTGRGE